jgi:hypothetical protein
MILSFGKFITLKDEVMVYSTVMKNNLFLCCLKTNPAACGAAVRLKYCWKLNY